MLDPIFFSALGLFSLGVCYFGRSSEGPQRTLADKTHRLGALGAMLLIFIGACAPGEGERCNPLRFTDECGQSD